MTGIAAGAAFLAGAAAGWWAGAAVALGALALLAAGGERRLIAPALAVAAVALLGAWRREPPPVGLPPTWVDVAQSIAGRVVTGPTVTGRYQRFVVAVDEVEVGDEPRAGSGLVCVTAPLYPELAVDDRVHAGGAARPVADEPAHWRPYFRQQGCSATLFAQWTRLETPGAGWRREVAGASRRLGAVLQQAAPGDTGALLGGFVTGDDHALSTERRDAFRLTGTTHLTAVSGANVALVVAIAVTVGAATGWRRRLGWQALTLGAVWSYALIAGLDPPAVRAALVASAALLAGRVGRRADYVTLILLGAASMVALEPHQIWRLSFQLSFAASLALAVVAPGLAPVGVAGWLRAALVMTLAAHLATLPILLPITGTASLVAIPANILVGPLVDVAFPLAAAGAVIGLAWPPLGEPLLLPARLLAGVVIAVVDGMAAAPGTGHVGTISRPVAALLAIVAAAFVITLSRDGRTWARRLAAAARHATRNQRTDLAGAPIGADLVGVGRRPTEAVVPDVRQRASTGRLAAPLPSLLLLRIREQPARPHAAELHDAVDDEAADQYVEDRADVGDSRQSVPRKTIRRYAHAHRPQDQDGQCQDPDDPERDHPPPPPDRLGATR